MRFDQLHEDFISAGLPITGVQRGGDGKGKLVPFSTVTWDGGFIGIDWASVPTDAQKTRAQQVADAHQSDRLTKTEKLGVLRDKRRAGLPLSAAEQQEAIDLLLGL